MFGHLVPAVAVATALIAVAAPAHSKDRLGYRAIAAQDFAKAERRLTAERRIFPGKPELMLNLAAVYAQTNRTGEARALYAEVLGRPAVDMDLSSGRVASSHAVAQAGLASLDRDTTYAAR